MKDEEEGNVHHDLLLKSLLKDRHDLQLSFSWSGWSELECQEHLESRRKGQQGEGDARIVKP